MLCMKYKYPIISFSVRNLNFEGAYSSFGKILLSTKTISNVPKDAKGAILTSYEH